MRSLKKSEYKFRQSHGPLLSKLHAARNLSDSFKEVAIEMLSYHDIITQTLKSTKAELNSLLL